ncbi:MAG: hypothetical protein K6T99_11565 [Armatimonadetes bacterium]|nr:hypothetical protein [Armatimonadota bacterium]
MLKAQIFHANSVDKLPKIHEQINSFVAQLAEDAIVSINTTEFGPAGVHDFYSYTVLIVYKNHE